MNRHEVHVFENGTASIRDIEAGETMHSQVGPDEEARQVYIEQSRLAERLTRLQSDGSEPLVLYDVGMGIASNALAALELPSKRKLHIVSFENTLEGLRLALREPSRFPTQARFRETLELLTRDLSWRSADGRVTWELRLGDFEKQELSPEPEVVFYDFYSPKSAPFLWTAATFERLFSACAKRRAAGQSTVLTTYSAATFVRSALLLSGFHVAYGAPTPLKSETTVAGTDMKELSFSHQLLGMTWLERLSRSSKPLPFDVAPSDHEMALRKVRASHQFRET